MNGFGKRSWRWGLVAAALAASSSCRKPVDAVKSDLGEAGYQITTADWFRASRNNEATALKKFLAAGFSIETREPSGDSALHAAANAGAKESADFLMDRGLAVDLRGASGHTPLMSAVMGGQTAMVKWLLRQGADPKTKDKDGFAPLMLAVREGNAGAVSELAPYSRELLDPAILLAALEGRTEVIDSLTNYGASVYARMEDGRTPLMIAAENGHADSVKLLLDIGASRLTTDTAGRTAADLATAAGHGEIATLLSRAPLPEELALESPAEVSKSMDGMVDAAQMQTPATPDSATDVAPSSSPNRKPSPPSISIAGETLSAVVIADPSPADNPFKGSSEMETLRLPPIVMRHYREREVPIQVVHVEGDTAILTISGANHHEVKVRAGETIPGSRLIVVHVQRRMKDSKLNLGQPAEVSVVAVRDTTTGTTREWISGVPSSAHDPMALIEDEATGRRYTASPGQRFKSADGTEFIVTDVRPNQLIIENTTTRAVRTLPLRGPLG